ncbi:MAG: iron-sulfur cluster assembly accessory protein [Actinobacteria bacterium]|nr:MAG: iron-sulfur cluster assembly accessory protein [Actinomycetota bacterium]
MEADGRAARDYQRGRRRYTRRRSSERPWIVTAFDTDTPTTATQGVILTSAAAGKVAELIAAEGDETLFLRLGVRPGGCSGFSYEMYFDTQMEETDIVSQTDGVRVVVDAESARLVAGATVDFKEMGLQGSGFAIENPNQQRSCGCGQSFC